jgi:hypothetical protein
VHRLSGLVGATRPGCARDVDDHEVVDVSLVERWLADQVTAVG